MWSTNSDCYGIRAPTFVPYEPFLLGVGVVFNILKVKSVRILGAPVAAGCRYLLSVDAPQNFEKTSQHAQLRVLSSTPTPKTPQT